MHGQGLSGPRASAAPYSQDRYADAIREAGLRLITLRSNPQYRFLTASAQKACATYGVKSFSLLAVKS